MNTPNTSTTQNASSGQLVLTPRQAALEAAQFHLLGGAACVALFVVFELPLMRFSFIRLGWWLGPWGDFPLPYDHDVYQWLHGSLSEATGLVLVTLIAFSSLLLVVHGAVFRVSALLHRWFGWPRYWSDVGGSLSLRTAWAQSARRSWWMWPAAVVIWELLTELATGLRYAIYPIICDGQPFLVANISTIVLGYFYTSAVAVREHMSALIGADELRCVKCDYQLRGLPTLVCPECAHPFDPAKKAEFRFKWERFDGRDRRRRIVRVLLPFTLLAAPLWMPLALLSVPRPWLRWVPSSLQTGFHVLRRNPHAFPIRPDAVCRIRHGETLYILRFRCRGGAYGATYVAGRWPNAESFGRHSPESRMTGEIGLRADPLPWEGPWNFRWQWGGGNIIWLYRPDATYEVEAMLVEDFDGDLSWAEEIEGNAP